MMYTPHYQTQLSGMPASILPTSIKASEYMGLNKPKSLSQGDWVASPAGRRLLVEDIFVPRSNKVKSRILPARFRSLGRKIVVFQNGSISPLKDVQAHYSVVV